MQTVRVCTAGVAGPSNTNVVFPARGTVHVAAVVRVRFSVPAAAEIVPTVDPYRMSACPSGMSSPRTYQTARLLSYWTMTPWLCIDSVRVVAPVVWTLKWSPVAQLTVTVKGTPAELPCVIIFTPIWDWSAAPVAGSVTVIELLVVSHWTNCSAEGAEEG